MRPSSFALRFDPRALAKVDLHLLTGCTLDPAMRQFQLLGETTDTALHRLVAAGETMIRN